MGIYKQFKRNVYQGDNVLDVSDIRYLPRWIILAIDAVICILSIWVSMYVLFKLNVKIQDDTTKDGKYLLIIGSNLIFMYLFKTYAGIIRHSTFVDIFKLFMASFCTVFFLWIVNKIYFYTVGEGTRLLLTPFLLLYFALSFTFLFLFRLFVKEFFYFAKEFRRSSLKKRILVLGIGEESVAVARAIIDNPSLPYYVKGFITQRTDSKRAKLLGKSIFPKTKLEEGTKEELGIDGVIVVKDYIAKEDLNSWVNLFLEKDLNVFKAPSVQKLRENDLSSSIRTLQIEDLLNRKPIKIDNDEVKKRHFNKVVLVTGGAGSIGSEIIRQVALFNPETIVVLDQAETPLHDMEIEMQDKFPHINFQFELADISNKQRLEPIFEKYKFSVVYHAAAYKHVPLMEKNPNEAILVNVLGSKNLALLASKYQVNRFVMISTDKAVNPTNVMGASKRAAEIFVQSLQNLNGNTTKFITTRFGNVLGSNGSVIPHFKKQIEKGGPLTITHPEIVRYFMTIPEACELVLEAGTMGKGGEIFVFDMGEPVKILDLARRMIKLSGFEPDLDIKIIYTGLRPGEKLYEELLSDETKTLPTHHEKIMIAKDAAMDFYSIDDLLQVMIKLALEKDKVEVVKLLKQIVPEFKSKNSVFEVLDR